MAELSDEGRLECRNGTAVIHASPETLWAVMRFVMVWIRTVMDALMKRRRQIVSCGDGAAPYLQLCLPQWRGRI